MSYVSENVTSVILAGDRVMNSLEHSGFTKPLCTSHYRTFKKIDDEGVMLSGGESQKVAIARAFYEKMPLCNS